MTTQALMPPTPEEAERAALASMIETSKNGLVVSSEIIAKGAGVEHRAVLQLISKHQAKIERFGQVAFEMRAGYNNAQVRVALLNEHQSTFLLTMMRNTEQVLEFKANLVEAFFKMAEQLTAPAPTGQNLLALAVLEAQRVIETKDATIAQLEPKAGAWDSMVNSSGYWSFNDAAKSLVNDGIKVGQNTLVRKLVQFGYLYRDHKGRPHVYQQFVEQGLFVQKIRTYRDTETGEELASSAPKVLITAKGLDRIRTRFAEMDAA